MTRDLTRGNPTKLIITFALPLLLGNMFQQIYSMADTIIVGRTIDINALAAVGATGSITFLILGFAQGLTSGFSIITAQKFGAEDYEGVRKSFTTSVILSLIITIILTFISVVFINNILAIMDTPKEIIKGSYSYIIIILYGIGASMVFNLLSSVIRALGDSKTPLFFLIVASVLNIILDFIFILNFSMGVSGAALATVISQFIASALCYIYIFRKMPILKLNKSHWIVDRKMVIEHLRVGLPMAFQISIIAIGAMILQATLNGLGVTSVGAFTAAQKIDVLAIQPLASFGVAMATYVAQNFGANNIDRIKVGIEKCIKISVTFSVIVGLVLILSGGYIVNLFIGNPDAEVIRLAKIYLITNCSMYFILALLFVFRNALQGLGKSFAPTVAGVMELIMRSFAALFLASKFGFIGVCLASPIAWIGATIPLGISCLSEIRKLKAKEDEAIDNITEIECV